MENGKALINFGDMTKPITALIEKLSNGAGIIYEPTRIKRQAKAEAEAKKIHAISKVELEEDIQKRALERFVREETIKQKNIEKITEKTFEKLDKNAKPENIEDDWIANFFDKIKFISDEEVQELWSKLLAGEANKPGSFSKRTIELISLLDKNDAELFNKLCVFNCSYGGLTTPLIYDFQNTLYHEYGISYGSLLHLQDIGLIQLNLNGFSLEKQPKKVTLSYKNKIIEMEHKNDKDNISKLGCVMFTSAGLELSIINNNNDFNDVFYEYILKKLEKDGLLVQEV